MEQTVNRYTDAEVVEHLTRSTHMDAAIRHLFQANFKPLSDFILQNKGTWSDVRRVVPYVVTQWIWMVQHGRFQAGTSISAFLFSLNRELWQIRISRKGQTQIPLSGKETLSPSAAAAVHRVAEETQLGQQWVRSFDLLGEDCKKILLGFYRLHHSSLHSAPVLSPGTERPQRAKRYDCLKKLEGVMRQHQLQADHLPSGYKSNAVFSNDLMRFTESVMGREEETRFREELNRNQTMQQEANRLALAVEVVRYYGLFQMVSGIQGDCFLNGPSPKENKRSTVFLLKRLVRIGLAVAAIFFLALLLMAGSYFYQLSTEKLYEEAYVEYPVSVIPRSDSAPVTIEEAYRQQNYAAVKKMSKKKRGYTDREFLLIGLSFLHLDDASAAIELLRWVTRWPGSSYKPDAEYYLAMAYLKDKDYDKAMEVMQRIRSNPDHLYYDQFPKGYIRKVRLLKWR